MKIFFSAGNPSQDVVYNVTSGLWACCYNGGGSTPDCSNPGSETFQADTPKNLFAAPFGSLITTSISTPAKTSTSSQSAPLLPSSPSNVSPSDPQTAIPLTPQPTNLSSTSNATSPDASSSSTNLTTSAKAGLSIGIIVAILAIAGLIYLFILRPRLQNEKSSKQHSAEVIEIGAGAPLVSNSKGYSKVATGSGSAAAGNGVIYELGLQDGAGANPGVVGYQQFNAKDGRAARSGLPGTREAGKENGNGISELG